MIIRLERIHVCDILVAVGKATLNGTVIFGKNSDRPPNESQPLVYQPRLGHEETTVRCQNIEIPQVSFTYAHIGSRPYWLWGYEHGVNEFGVAIGNLGVHSKEPYKTPADQAGLIGMDLVRLGLERGETAHEAMIVITRLLEAYGAGYCESPNVAKYHNNYMVADPCEAWVLETAGRYWVARRIKDGVYYEGNLYSIQTYWDRCHQGLVSHAVEMGWCDSELDFNFARTYSDYLNHPTKGSMIRYRRGKQLLEKYEGRITPEVMMEMLRDHLEGTFLESFWAPGENFFPSICRHEAPGGGNQTAASMVVELRRDMPDLLRASCWAGMSTPCTSVFMPFYPKGVSIPGNLSVADDAFSERSPWWVFKRLQRHTERNYPVLGPVARSAWKDAERRMVGQRSKVERAALQLIEEGEEAEAVELLQEFVNTCSEESLGQAGHLNRLLYGLEKTVPKYKDLREAYLNSLNKEAKIEI